MLQIFTSHYSMYIYHFLLQAKRLSGAPFILLVPRLQAALLTEYRISSVPSALVGPVVAGLDETPLPLAPLVLLLPP